MRYGICVEHLDSTQEMTGADDGNASDHSEGEETSSDGEILGHAGSREWGPKLH